MSTMTVVTAVLCIALFDAKAQAGPLAKKPSRPFRFTATAYCQSGRTESGARTRSGIVAADPRVLPVGSVVRIDLPFRSYSGVYTVMDTGGAVKGRKVDLFIPDCRRARQFGRRAVQLRVLREGWGPQARVQER